MQPFRIGHWISRLLTPLITPRETPQFTPIPPPRSLVPSAAFADPRELTGETWAYDGGRRLVLGRNDSGELLALGGGFRGRQNERHLITIAGSQSGKSSTSVIPNLRNYQGSMVVIDVKGELARETAELREKFGSVVVLDPFGVSGCKTSSLNPFDGIDPTETGLLARLDSIVEALIITDDKDPHWSDTARDVMRFCVLLAFREAKLLGTPTLTAIRSIIMKGHEGRSLSGRSEATGLFQSLMDTEADWLRELSKEAAEELVLLANAFAETSEKELASILSTARRNISFLRGSDMAAAVAPSKINLRDLKKKPMTVYVCIPPEKLSSHSRWLRLLLMMTVEACTYGDKPADDVVLVLDEFAALGHMATIEQASAQMAGYGLKMWIILQDITQLQDSYPKAWQTFVQNAEIVQVFGIDTGASAEWIEKQLGYHTYTDYVANERTLQAAASGATSHREEKTRAPLLPAFLVGQKYARETGRQLLIRKGGKPVECFRLAPNEFSC